MRRRYFPLVAPLTALLACGGGQPASSPAVTAPRPTAAAVAPPASAPPPAAQRTWIERSNDDAQILLEVLAHHAPERASGLGVESADDRILDLSSGHAARMRADYAAAADKLRALAASESDPLVKEDLSILTRAADRTVKRSSVVEAHQVPFYAVAELVFGSMHGLLEDRVAASRRPSALARLRKYAGLEPGTTPATDLARAEIREKLAAPGLMPPYARAVKKAIDDTPVLLDGIAKLLAKYDIKGYEDALAAFSAQAKAYADFLTKEVLPKAREDFRLAPEVYAVELEDTGVDAPPAELAAMGHQGFDAIQAEMQKVAAVVAEQRKLPSKDYRDVVKALKADQLSSESILPTYQQRLSDVEGIIREHHLVTLPSRPARIRLATAAETAQQPAPHMSPPRLIGNTGEPGEFVLPLVTANGKMDDFTYAAASWTLVAHEARPGHELQFDSMVEHGVSLARAIFAFNSANVEGWGLYSEYITYPFMPPEGQLVSLLLRLHRAARIFLDPELQMGKWTFETAQAFLEKNVVLSPAFARTEVERYTFRMPGQATAYYYGWQKLMDIRKDIEGKLGTGFDLQKFDDAVIAQGLMPPDLLHDAVLAALTAHP